MVQNINAPKILAKLKKTRYFEYNKKKKIFYKKNIKVILSETLALIILALIQKFK